MLRRMSALIVLLTVSPGNPLLADITYDAVKDFSTAANPNGVWQFRYGTGTASSLMTKTESINNGNVVGWINDPNNAIPNRADVDKNVSSSTQTIGTIVLPTNLLRLDGEAFNDTVRWTAPTTTSWSIQGLFQGIDVSEGAHNVEILKNSSQVILAPSAINSYGSTALFNTTLSLKAGDTIDFISLTGNGGYNLSTGLSAQISAVPEPTSFILTGIASVCGACHWWRKQRRLRAGRLVVPTIQ